MKRMNQAAQPNHARDAPNPDIKTPKYLKEPKEKDEDLKTQKAPRNHPKRKRRSQDAEKV